MIISIDFDGCIVDDRYPNICELKPNAKMVINRLYDNGHKILINTCRTGKYEGFAYDFLVKNGIKFNYMNCNLPSQVEIYGQDCRKLSVDIYIDDKNLLRIPEDWLDILKLILDK